MPGCAARVTRRSIQFTEALLRRRISLRIGAVLCACVDTLPSLKMLAECGAGSGFVTPEGSVYGPLTRHHGRLACVYPVDD